MQLQHKAKCILDEAREYVSFQFMLGPILVYCTVPLPDEKGDSRATVSIEKLYFNQYPCRTTTTNSETDMIVFSFDFGPMEIACLVNVPREQEQFSIAYVKISLREREKVWEEM